MTTLLAATALATTGAAGLVGNSASAGCGATIEVENHRASSITVDWEDSDSRSRVNTPFGWVNGTWKRLVNNATTTVASGDTESKAVVLDFGCNVSREYRLEINSGGSSWFVYSGWHTSATKHVNVW